MRFKVTVQTWRLLAGSMVILLVALCQHTTPLGWIETRLYDLRVRMLSSQHAISSEIVVVAIDESSLRRLEPSVGRCPWPRAVLASVVEYCSDAKVVAVDILFS